ncbi:uncharacterized protein TNCV_879951 [Trichonephila clavipes]|nr:uncharacterized protein TNCV_879951 [Trichonephila clavipes]
MYIQDRFGSYRSIELTKTDWNCTRNTWPKCIQCEWLLRAVVKGWSRRLDFGRPRGTAEREDHRIRSTAAAHRTASEANIQAVVGTTVTQQIVGNWLLQGQLRAMRAVACIPLTPSHSCLPFQWCQTRAHWMAEWRSVEFSDECRFCFVAINGRVLVRRKLGEGP